MTNEGMTNDIEKTKIDSDNKSNDHLMKIPSENSLMTVSQKRKYEQDESNSEDDYEVKTDDISQGKKINPEKQPIIKKKDNATREFNDLMAEIDRMPKYYDVVENKIKQNRNKPIQSTNIAIQQNEMIKQDNNTKSKLKAI